MKIQGYESDSEDCRGNGTLVCGMCSCNAGFYGKQCECEGNELGARNAATLEECKPNNETSEICSGRGACKCGTCDCARRPNPQEVFYGKYCECDNFSCKRSGGLVRLNAKIQRVLSVESSSPIIRNNFLVGKWLHDL